MYNVLIVDEEEHLLWALEKNLFPDRDDIEIITATNGETGLEALRDQRVDLLVCDIKMPGKIDGFQLILRAKEVAPDSRVIIMTAFGTHRIQNFADRIGITHYIEKPFNVSELRVAILDLLDEKEGFQGVLSDLELTDIIQMLCLAKRTALLHLKHREHRGKIVFERGDVVHSEFDGLKGDEAVFQMLALRQGDIFMQSDFQNDETTVTMSWQDLLFEGVKRADEERAQIDVVDDSTDVGMGVSESEVESVLGARSEMESESALDSEASIPFFSDAELAEIERASEAKLDSFDELGDDLDASLDAEESSSPGDEAFETSRTDTNEHPSPTVLRDPDEVAEEVVEFRAPFREHVEPKTREAPVLNPSQDGFGELLRGFSDDCPGLKITGILSPEEGMAMDFIRADSSSLEPDAIAAFFGDVVGAAARTVQSLSQSAWDEVQIELEGSFVLLKRIPKTPYVHVSIVDNGTSLGVALVLMRRFQKNLRASLEA